MKLSPRFEEALIYVTRLHSDQMRKGTETPYVAHLLSVAGIVIDHGGQEDEAIAALLHDAIEDQGGAEIREEIRKRFGDTVVDIVNGCTDAEVEPKPEWRRRKEAYVSHLVDASASVWLVSAADKLDNARAILRDYRVMGEALWSRFNGGQTGYLMVLPHPGQCVSFSGLDAARRRAHPSCHTDREALWRPIRLLPEE
jgi:(p)ppGpp synthase/HD superfamily hydrolase